MRVQSPPVSSANPSSALDLPSSESDPPAGAEGAGDGDKASARSAEVPEDAPAPDVVAKPKRKKKPVTTAAAAPAPVAQATDDTLPSSEDISKLSRYGYIAGLAGMAALLVTTYFVSRRKLLDNGWLGLTDRHAIMASVLVIVALVMLAIEVGIRVKVEGKGMIAVAPDVKEGNWGRFLGECLLIFGIDFAVLSLVFAFYEHAGEYGFARANSYYKPWITIMGAIRTVYLYGGLPYVIFTRALQYDPAADKKLISSSVRKLATWLWARAVTKPGQAPEVVEGFNKNDRTAILGLMVKGFFIPVMTVFFADQFTHLVRNYDFFFDNVLAKDQIRLPLKDAYNVSLTLIFSVDVGLAWAGYVFSTRWIKNTMFSVEPTAAGWAVALLCYPPINRVFGFYFSTPGDHAFLTVVNGPFLVFFAAASITSFVVYTSATVVFGLRFSNLTHRGIITTGPYAYVRHPAYASKNFSWWCVMLPVALIQAKTNGVTATILHVVGLIALSSMYMARALTEERHLKRDPEYQAYMKKVPYRFIPGII